MKVLRKICWAIVIVFAFASCGSEKDNELGLEDLNYIYSKAYDDNEYWREFGYGYSSSDSSALELAKYNAYNALLLKALFNLYPNLQLNYDRSILADNNIVFDTIIRENKNNYESYVALEVPIQVMEEAIKMAVEGPKIIGWYESYPPKPIYQSSYEENINYRILNYKLKKGLSKYKKEATLWSTFDDAIKEQKYDSMIKHVPDDEIDYEFYKEEFERYFIERKTDNKQPDSINN